MTDPQIPPDPFPLFDSWLTEAIAGEPNDPNAMTVATVGADGRPSARVVLLRGHGPDGFVFFTNTQSRKGDEIAAHRQVALLFHWKSLRRQIRIEGAAEPVTPTEADAYHASRARNSRLGAWASDQSRPLLAREILEQRVAEMDARYPGDIPRPPHWAGYRIRPVYFEFWQDMPFRLHDRMIYGLREGGDGWDTGRLFP